MADFEPLIDPIRHYVQVDPITGRILRVFSPSFPEKVSGLDNIREITLAEVALINEYHKHDGQRIATMTAQERTDLDAEKQAFIDAQIAKKQAVIDELTTKGFSNETIRFLTDRI